MCNISKNYKLHTILFIVVTAISAITSSYGVASASSPQGKQWVVVIDAGHGGHDPGAVGSRSREKDIVLDIALKTGNYIEENLKDVKVIYTRKTDQFVELYKRADIANKNKADLFISIHANSVTNKSVRGSETWVMGLHTDEKNLELAMKENAVITMEKDYTTRYEGYDPKSTESFIIFSLMQNTYIEQSTSFASSIQDQFRQKVNLGDRGVKQAGLIVLWQSTMPSVLVEVGFISNVEEEKFLMTTNGRDYIASAIFRAFRDYKRVIDSKSTFTTSQADVVRSSGNNIEFCIQVASSRSKSDTSPSSFSGLEGIHEVDDGGRFKYLSGRYPTYEEALVHRKIVEKYYPDAFVVAIQNNKIIPLQQAIESSKK